MYICVNVRQERPTGNTRSRPGEVGQIPRGMLTLTVPELKDALYGIGGGDLSSMLWL